MEEGKIQTLHNYETGEAVIPRTVPRAIVAEGTPGQVLGLVDEKTVGLLNGNDIISSDDTPTEASDLPVKSGGVYDALQKKSGENLLINSDFRNPINQRGKLLYTGNVNTIDQWRMWSSTSDQSLAVMDGFIRYTPGTSTGNFTQRTDGKSRNLVAGTVVTFSVLTASGKIEVVSGELSDSEYIYSPPATAWNGDIQIAKIEANTGVVMVIIDGLPGSVLDLVACKLELGSEQTLAHKEGDTWVLNDPPPDPALELAKCQRYQVELNRFGVGASYIGMAMAYSDGVAYAEIPLPVTLCKTPTVTMTGKWTLMKFPNDSHAITTVRGDMLSANMVSFFIGSSGLTPGDTYILYPDNDKTARMFVDANL